MELVGSVLFTSQPVDISLSNVCLSHLYDLLQVNLFHIVFL